MVKKETKKTSTKIVQALFSKGRILTDQDLGLEIYMTKVGSDPH